MTFGRVMMACAVGWAAVACSGNVILSSPDGNIKVEHALSEEGVPVLRVSAYGEGVMEISAAGLVAEEAGLCTGFEIADIDRSSVDMIWTQPWGENKSVIDRHREMAVSLKNDDGMSLVLRVRAFGSSRRNMSEYGGECTLVRTHGCVTDDMVPLLKMP